MLLFFKTFLGLGLLSLAYQVQATPIVVTGDHFSIAYDDASVYKQAWLSGSQDTVYFTPTTLLAVTGGAPATTQASLQFTLSIHPGYTFAGLVFAERGNYFLSSGGQVVASADLQAANADTLASTSLALTPGGTLDQIGGATWSLGGLLDPQGLGAAQTLGVKLDSTLRAEPTQGIGFIQNTYIGFQIQTREVQAVPEPSGLVLVLAGALAAAAARRRRVRGLGSVTTE